MLFFPIQISIWRQIPRESTKERWTSYHAFISFLCRPTAESEWRQRSSARSSKCFVRFSPHPDPQSAPKRRWASKKSWRRSATASTSSARRTGPNTKATAPRRWTARCFRRGSSVTRAPNGRCGKTSWCNTSSDSSSASRREGGGGSWRRAEASRRRSGSIRGGR